MSNTGRITGRISKTRKCKYCKKLFQYEENNKKVRIIKTCPECYKEIINKRKQETSKALKNNKRKNYIKKLI